MQDFSQYECLIDPVEDKLENSPEMVFFVFNFPAV